MNKNTNYVHFCMQMNICHVLAETLQIVTEKSITKYEYFVIIMARIYQNENTEENKK
jgi:hypothetical protein